jgi:NTE family protein
VARPKIALALGGGGMRGAAHVGVLRALLKAQIPVNMIAGTSMGAIVGGLYSAGIDVDALDKKFADGSLMKSFMPLPVALTLAAAPVMAVPKTLERDDYDGLYSGRKFRKYIDRTVPEYQQNIESLRIPFAAVALNLVDGKTYALTRGNLGAALQASSAVPGLREPVRIGNQLFVDGGVVDNIPVDVARSMGADIVIAVNVNERFDVVPPEGFKPVGSVTKRIVTLQLASDAAMHLQAADFVIHPNVDGIGLTSTKIKDARSAIEAGEKAAWQAIPSIKEKLRQAELLSQ